MGSNNNTIPVKQTNMSTNACKGHYVRIINGLIWSATEIIIQPTKLIQKWKSKTYTICNYFYDNKTLLRNILTKVKIKFKLFKKKLVKIIRKSDYPTYLMGHQTPEHGLEGRAVLSHGEQGCRISHAPYYGQGKLKGGQQWSVAGGVPCSGQPLVNRRRQRQRRQLCGRPHRWHNEVGWGGDCGGGSGGKVGVVDRPVSALNIRPFCPSYFGLE